MLRTLKLSVVGLVALGIANAGALVPVDLSGVTLPSGDVSATVSTCTNVATGINQVCSAPTPTGNTYMNSTFAAVLPAGTTLPTTSNVNQNVTVGANSLPFLLGSEPDNSNQQFAIGGTQTDAQIVVDLNGYNPVTNASAGVFSVSDIYTMIQGDVMSSGDQGLSILFSGKNSLGNAATYEFILTAGVDYRGINNRQTVSSDIAGGPTAAVATATDYNPDSGNGCLLNGVVTAGCSIVVNNNAFGGTVTTKNYYMDVQELVLPSLNNPFANGGLLQSITISSDAFGTGNTTQNEGLFLSGIDLVTPEPGTLVLFGAGVGLIALWNKRRVKTTV